jgi:hypothetical protein
MNRSQSASVCTLLVLVLAAAACSSSATSSSSPASAPGVTATQVSVGLVTSLTGLAAANFTGAEQGAAARFALQNAAGGVGGRTIKMTVADDQSSPTGAKTAVDSLASGTFGQIFISDFTTQAYRTTAQAKIPVVGAPNDGPEWGEQPNTNEAAGRNLTRASFIAKIRTISWDGGGLLPGPVDLSLAGFGKAPATSCAYFAQLKGSTFVPMNGGKPYCGHAVGS